MPQRVDSTYGKFMIDLRGAFARDGHDIRCNLSARDECCWCGHRGRNIGSSDATGSEVKDDPYKLEDIIATAYDRFGLDPTQEFQSPIGRPVKLSNGGEVMRKLFD